MAENNHLPQSISVSDIHFAFLVLLAKTNNITLEEQLSRIISPSIQAVIVCHTTDPGEKPAAATLPDCPCENGSCDKCGPHPSETGDEGAQTDAEDLVPCGGVEIPGVCETCEAVDDCKTRDPKAGCITAIMEKQPEPLRCRELSTIGHCQINGDCSRKTAEERAAVGCHVEIEIPKKPLTRKKPEKPAEEKKVVEKEETHCCDTCKGGHENPDVITMDCPDYSDVSSGKINGAKLREDTRRLGCKFWSAPGSPSKIPNVWGWCVARGCKSISSVDGICTTTGQKVKDMTYCPTQHLIGEKP